MEARLFFRPDKPEPEDHGDRLPYDLLHVLPLGTQVLYPTGRVYELIETGADVTAPVGYPRRWSGIPEGKGHRISPHVKMHALMEGITLPS